MTTKIEISPMPRGDVLVYKFGVRIDKDCIAAVSEQIAKARLLYNNLIGYMRQSVAARAAREFELAGDGAKKMKAAIDMLTAQFQNAKTANDRARMAAI